MSQYSFSQVPYISIPRSKFNRTHTHKTTFNASYLIPFFIDEALPGDTFECKSTLFGRLATPIVPIMDNMYIDTFYFAVPNRLLWENWEKFNGAQDNPGDSTDYLIPTIKSPAGGWPVGSLSDYFGLPTNVDNLEVSSLWHRAYNMIYNEWFRDENLQDSVDVPKGDGPDSDSTFKLLKRGKRHDYFTSCLPFPQKGPGVEIPLSGNAPVYGVDGVNAKFQKISNPSILNIATRGGVNPDLYVVGGPGESGMQWPTKSVMPQSALYADMSDVTSATINSLRQAFQIQRILEKDARGGTRYVEILKCHFGVTAPDFRLQRPEYLGGGTQPVYIKPVEQTSSTDSTTPQGNLAGYGIISTKEMAFKKSFVEHSVIIGLCCVRGDITYQQGINRMFNRKTRFDYYWPSLAHLGEQAVLSKEIYADGTPDDEKVFGYQERFAEYRYKPSQITGKLRSTDPQSLDVWHLAQKFDNRPVLSAEFIQDATPVNRVIAVQNEPQFIFDAYIKLYCSRPMPLYSVPGLVDHF